MPKWLKEEHYRPRDLPKFDKVFKLLQGYSDNSFDYEKFRESVTPSAVAKSVFVDTGKDLGVMIKDFWKELPKETRIAIAIGGSLYLLAQTAPPYRISFKGLKMYTQDQLENLAEIIHYEDIDGWGIGEMVESEIDDDIEITAIEFTPNIQDSNWDELSKPQHKSLLPLGDTEIFNLVGIVKLYLDTSDGEMTTEFEWVFPLDTENYDLSVLKKQNPSGMFSGAEFKNLPSYSVIAQEKPPSSHWRYMHEVEYGTTDLESALITARREADELSDSEQGGWEYRTAVFKSRKSDGQPSSRPIKTFRPQKGGHNQRNNPSITWEKRPWGFLGVGIMKGLEIAENADARSSGGKYRLQTPTGYGRWKERGNGTLAEMKKLAQSIRSIPRKRGSKLAQIDLGFRENPSLNSLRHNLLLQIAREYDLEVSTHMTKDELIHEIRTKTPFRENPRNPEVQEISYRTSPDRTSDGSGYTSYEISSHMEEWKSMSFEEAKEELIRKFNQGLEKANRHGFEERVEYVDRWGNPKIIGVELQQSHLDDKWTHGDRIRQKIQDAKDPKELAVVRSLTQSQKQYRVVKGRSNPSLTPAQMKVGKSYVGTFGSGVMGSHVWYFEPLATMSKSGKVKGLLRHAGDRKPTTKYIGKNTGYEGISWERVG